MGKAGFFVTIPRAGANCLITLDSGETVIVNHDQGGSKSGRVTTEVPRFMGISDRIYTCDLKGPEGTAILRHLTGDARQGNLGATPLGAFVEYLKDPESVAEIKARCSILEAIR